MTARDYRKGAARRPRGASAGFSGWTGLVIGLGLGLAVAAGVWHYKSRPPVELAAARSKKPAPLSASDEAPDKEPPGSGTDYTFYDRLKNFEVVIPEKEKDVHRDLRPAPETRPGTYVLQAGSYKNFAEADQVRARLALQGVESKVQKVTVDTDTWHRVRIGPITNLDQLNRIRTRLRQADVDALVIRVGD
ncbi:MAG TPA: SPOR domain-containing protein [Steroidobacteraceae bacterium]|nr:SPOR domain-containing protein [Steroidobacteraceae bacterium]